MGPGPKWGQGPSGARAQGTDALDWLWLIQDQDNHCEVGAMCLIILIGFGFGYSQFRITLRSQGVNGGMLWFA